MSHSLTEQKQLLRTRVLATRDRLSENEIAAKSAAICRKLLSTPEVQQSGTIFCYVSFKSEVITHDLIRSLLKSGKKVAVPAVDQTTRTMSAVIITDFDRDLQPGTMGILEPLCTPLHRTAPEQIDLTITPGAAFSRAGWRIGYGGGFYDRFLGKTPTEALTLALAYDLQILPQIPHNPDYDIPMRIILTESRTINCAKQCAPKSLTY
ncbi:MAG: 5-formyltetrahydrofolate cyclo-ligase [Deltaproteobacteria bacterium]|nr:5-formyltetrahydrofolate cyclo-ligase [Deltaproteobacteria bacterium]